MRKPAEITVNCWIFFSLMYTLTQHLCSWAVPATHTLLPTLLDHPWGSVASLHSHSQPCIPFLIHAAPLHTFLCTSGHPPSQALFLSHLLAPPVHLLSHPCILSLSYSSVHPFASSPLSSRHLPACWLGICNFLTVSPLTLIVGSQQEATSPNNRGIALLNDAFVLYNHILWWWIFWIQLPLRATYISKAITK